MLNDPNKIKLDAEVNLGLTDDGMIVIENKNGSAAMKLKPELAAELAGRLMRYSQDGLVLSAARRRSPASRLAQ
jgi:hypothetical protein